MLNYIARFAKARLTALHEERERRGMESPYTEWLANWEDPPKGRAGLEITTRVPCAGYFTLRDQALLAHATQIDPESSWFACPVEVAAAARPPAAYHRARAPADAGLPAGH